LRPGNIGQIAEPKLTEFRPATLCRENGYLLKISNRSFARLYRNVDSVDIGERDARRGDPAFKRFNPGQSA
jgi:hypothetical protein